MGKERVLEMIHENSSRRGNPCIKVNCGSVNSDLLEEEIFGTAGKKGAFELADNGIIFLDEIFVREKIDFRIFIIISAVLIIGMLVFSAIKHVQITAGMMTVINRLYDIGEKAQSYVYDRFRIEMNADTRKKVGATASRPASGAPP